MSIEKINVGGNEYDVCDAQARAMAADAFSEGESYTAGKICIHENKLCMFTADKSAGPWDASKVKETTLAEIYSELNSRGTVISNNAVVPAVQGQDYPVVSITLKSGHKYLVLAHIVSLTDSTDLLVCSIKSGEGASQFGGGSCYSTRQSGGGTMSYAIVDCTLDVTCSLYSYGYSAESYNVNGDIAAIQLQ